MSDRIAIMNEGKVEQLGTPEELYERPATRFVADFIGTTNLLRGTVDADGAVRLTTGELAPCAIGELARRSEVEISVRPEAITLVPPEAIGAIRGSVEQAAYLGNTVSYQVRTSGGLVVSVLCPEDRDPTPGRQRCRRHVARRGRARPRRPLDPPAGGDPHDARTRRVDHRPRTGPAPLHARASHHRAASSSSGSARSAPRPRSHRSSPRARRRPRPRPPRRRPARRHRLPRPPRPRAPRPSPRRSPPRNPSSSSTTGPSTSARTSIPSFEDKYGVKVTHDFFANTDEAYAKLGTDGGGYDSSFPISVDIPAFVAKGALLELDKSLIPNIVNLGAGVGRPEVRPGQRPFGAVHVVDDRHRLRHHARSPTRRPAARPSGTRAMRQHIGDARRLPGGLRPGAHPAGLRRQHVGPRPARRGDRAPRAAEAARPRLHDRHPRR